MLPYNNLGEWPSYEELKDRIAELEAQLAAMTDERDSESRWAKKYSDEADELRQQLAAAQENTLGPWFLTQGLCTLDAIADHIITLQRQLTAAQERGVVLARGILAVQNLINESRGVDGYHRNGNIAEWDALLDDGCILDEYSNALNLIHKITTDSLRETSRTARAGGRPCRASMSA